MSEGRGLSSGCSQRGIEQWRYGIRAVVALGKTQDTPESGVGRGTCMRQITAECARKGSTVSGAGVARSNASTRSTTQTSPAICTPLYYKNQGAATAWRLSLFTIQAATTPPHLSVRAPRAPRTDRERERGKGLGRLAGRQGDCSACKQRQRQRQTPRARREKEGRSNPGACQHRVQVA